MMSSKHFYRNLKTLQLPVTEVFHADNFSDVPADWFIIMSDIKDSTTAVSSGKHNDVNLIAAGSLIVGLNVAKAAGIEIPFFFGGDGGTLLVPEELLKDTINGLLLHNANTIKNFNLQMHIGSISIKDVLNAGHYLQIAKVKYGSGFNKPVIIGDGLPYAEKRIKGANENPAHETAEKELDLTGLECKWNRIKPPGEKNEIVCYLIEAANPQMQIEVYKNVMGTADEIYGNEQIRSPLSVERLKLLFKLEKFKKELLAKYGKWKINTLISSFIKSFAGRFYFKYNFKANDLKGREYLRQVIDNADTLTIDGRINTIISGTMDKRIKFLQFLNEQEQKGNLLYGHHISTESVMTCYIENYNEKHIHFVDGANGGYTEAAKELKQKLAGL
jgi:hypothetical protein